MGEKKDTEVQKELRMGPKGLKDSNERENNKTTKKQAKADIGGQTALGLGEEGDLGSKSSMGEREKEGKEEKEMR